MAEIILQLAAIAANVTLIISIVKRWKMKNINRKLLVTYLVINILVLICQVVLLVRLTHLL